jgi:hypothetical protein
MNKLIESIWKQYFITKPTAQIEKEILDKAQKSKQHAEAHGDHFRLETSISWWTRYFVQQKKRNTKK